jgi:hypothetical protein
VLVRLLAGGINLEPGRGGGRGGRGGRGRRVGRGGRGAGGERGISSVGRGAGRGAINTEEGGTGGTAAGTGPQGAGTTVPQGNRSKGGKKNKQLGGAGPSQNEQVEGGKRGDGKDALGAKEQAESNGLDQPLLSFGGVYRLQKRPVERMTSRAWDKVQRRVELQGGVTARRVLRRGEVGPRPEVRVDRRRGGGEMLSPKRSVLAKRRKAQELLKTKVSNNRPYWIR